MVKVLFVFLDPKFGKNTLVVCPSLCWWFIFKENVVLSHHIYEEKVLKVHVSNLINAALERLRA